jgi:hypothetical protein
MPGACHVTMEPQNELPLRLAARHGTNVAVDTRLCETYSAACQNRNSNRQLALHLAVRSPTASPDMVRVLLHVCSLEQLLLADASERHSLLSLVLVASAKALNAVAPRAVLDHTPPQKFTANAHKWAVTPLFALSPRKSSPDLGQRPQDPEYPLPRGA